MKKKGQLAQLQPLVTSLVAVGVLLVVGFLIMATVKTQVTNSDGGGENSTSWNATNDTIEAMGTIPTWLPIIVITVIGALLIGLVAFFKPR